jgi:hypothetical protein
MSAIDPVTAGRIVIDRWRLLYNQPKSVNPEEWLGLGVALRSEVTPPEVLEKFMRITLPKWLSQTRRT